MQGLASCPTRRLGAARASTHRQFIEAYDRPGPDRLVLDGSAATGDRLATGGANPERPPRPRPGCSISVPGRRSSWVPSSSATWRRTCAARPRRRPSGSPPGTTAARLRSPGATGPASTARFSRGGPPATTTPRRAIGGRSPGSVRTPASRVGHLTACGTTPPPASGASSAST